MIGVPVKNLSDGKLNSIMSGIGCMIGPADGLFQIIGSTVIQCSAQEPSGKTIVKVFFICGFYAKSFGNFQY